jgi:ATP:corrinoid adenosyltransferase
VKRVVDLLDKKSDNLELVFTGRKCPQELIERADLVSVIHEISTLFRRD